MGKSVAGRQSLRWDDGDSDMEIVVRSTEVQQRSGELDRRVQAKPRGNHQWSNQNHH